MSVILKMFIFQKETKCR